MVVASLALKLNLNFPLSMAFHNRSSRTFYSGQIGRQSAGFRGQRKTKEKQTITNTNTNLTPRDAKSRINVLFLRPKSVDEIFSTFSKDMCKSYLQSKVAAAHTNLNTHECSVHHPELPEHLEEPS